MRVRVKDRLCQVMAYNERGKKMKHEKLHDSAPLTGVLDTFYRKVVNNSGSKTLALSEILDDFHFVRI